MKMENDLTFHFSFYIFHFHKDAGFFCKAKVSLGQLLEGGIDGPGPGDHNDIPAGLECFLVEPVDFPQAAADPVSDMGFPQFFADGDAHPVGTRPVAPGIEHQKPVGLAVGVIQTPKNVVEL